MREPFEIEETEPASWAISSLLRATKNIHEGMRRADPGVRRSMLQQAQSDIAKATQGLNEAIAQCVTRSATAQSESRTDPDKTRDESGSAQ